MLIVSDAGVLVGTITRNVRGAYAGERHEATSSCSVRSCAGTIIWRVLRRNGKLFHYIGDPDSKSGARTTKGVVRRLQEAGFTRIVPKPQAFGVAAYK